MREPAKRSATVVALVSLVTIITFTRGQGSQAVPTKTVNIASIKRQSIVGKARQVGFKINADAVVMESPYWYAWVRFGRCATPTKLYFDFTNRNRPFVIDNDMAVYVTSTSAARLPGLKSCF